MSDVVYGALGAAGVGLGAGLGASVLVLQLRRLRNALLVRRGGSPIRDCLRPPFALPCAVLGLPLGAGLTLAVPVDLAIALGGCVLPALLLLASGGYALATAFGHPPPTERP